MYYLSICTLSYNGSVLFYLFTIFSPLWFLVVFIWNTKTSIWKRLTLSLMAQVHLNKIWQFPSLIKQKHFTVAIYIFWTALNSNGWKTIWFLNYLLLNGVKNGMAGRSIYNFICFTNGHIQVAENTFQGTLPWLKVD